MKTIHIRDYADSDYEDVRKNLEDGALFDADWDSRENLTHKIERNPGSIIVAIADHEVIGNVYIVEDGWAAFIFRLAVRKPYRRRGIATMLLKEAEKRLAEKGVKEVALLVRNEEDELKSFYGKRGYALKRKYHGMAKEL